MEKNKVVYSFSRLESFHQCPFGYYLTYVKGDRGDDNIYSYLGSLVHEILEDLQSGKTNRENALSKFKDGLEDAEVFGYEFMNENIKRKYETDIVHYLENYKPIETKEYHMERKFEIEIDGVWIKGFIDLYYLNEDGEIVVIDYKTSSKFSAKDLPKKSRQLMLYAFALEQLEGIKVNKVGFDMLKYISKPWRNKMVLKERCEINELEFDEYKNGYVILDYDKDAINDVKKYIKDTVKEIESLDPEEESDWTPCMDFERSFFCKNLCGNFDKCKYQKNKINF